MSHTYTQSVRDVTYSSRYIRSSTRLVWCVSVCHKEMCCWNKWPNIILLLELCNWIRSICSTHHWYSTWWNSEPGITVMGFVYFHDLSIFLNQFASLSFIPFDMLTLYQAQLVKFTVEMLICEICENYTLVKINSFTVLVGYTACVCGVLWW